MGNINNHDKTAGVEKRGWLRKNFVSLLILFLVIAISVGLFFFAQRYPEKLKEFAHYGYLGFFIVSLVGSTTILLPMPGILVVFPLVAVLNPFLLAVAGATGGIIGEITGYMAGYSGRGMAQGGRMYKRVDGWMKRWGSWTIFIFAAVPFFPFDIAGVVAGALRYPLWKFLVIGGVGKILKYIAFVFAAAWGWEVVLRYFG
jgi:uncharacterized membrane protein YdjX (TVP38/TMEM64 family)